MSGFSIDWLNLREDADLRARDPDLLNQALDWLEAGSATLPVVVDLGAGTGATLRAFTIARNLLAVRTTWRLLDHDKTLLAEANRRHGDSLPLETLPVDLKEVAITHLKGARLVTASALFDLVSADFLEALITTLLQASEDSPVGIYAALNYDGTTHWEPRHPYDNAVLAAFNRDQQQDKGFGPALGPDAGKCLTEKLSRAGFEVLTADSPWQLGASDQNLVRSLIEGIAEAVTQDTVLDSTVLVDWVKFRLLHAETGVCRVGHSDILAFRQPR